MLVGNSQDFKDPRHLSLKELACCSGETPPPTQTYGVRHDNDNDNDNAEGLDNLKADINPSK